jgi:hypothetical protein
MLRRTILDFGFWILDFGFWIDEARVALIASPPPRAIPTDFSEGLGILDF